MDYKHNKRLTSTARALRKNMTKEERKLWFEFLRLYDVKFYRQRVIANYVVDFYCSKAKLVIELDGSQHYEPEAQARDAERTAALERYGLTVLRIPNSEVNKNFLGVCEHIDAAVKSRIDRAIASPVKGRWFACEPEGLRTGGVASPAASHCHCLPCQGELSAAPTEGFQINWGVER